jgi:hypothetical protein
VMMLSPYQHLELSDFAIAVAAGLALKACDLTHSLIVM